MDIKKLIIQNISDNMPEIHDSTPVGSVMKYADDVIAAAEIAAEQYLSAHNESPTE